jgi:hypothetical protein
MKIIFTFFFVVLTSALFGQSRLLDHTALSTKLETLAGRYPELVQLHNLTNTTGGSEIWLLELGKGNRDQHPGIAVFGGLDSRHIAGTSLAVGMAEKLLTLADTDSISGLLESTTFYFFPMVNPDAVAQYFADLKYERGSNATPADDDRDGYTDEDPFEDLNGDGLITRIRVEDPTGRWIIHDQDPRLMVQAEMEEAGRYLLYTEGLDNDQDEKFNEDGPGGVIFNKNLPYNYPAFSTGAGNHPVSEKEHRAILDDLYDRWNIYLVLTFGPANNLTTPWKSNPADSAKRIPRTILKSDEELSIILANKYQDLVPLQDRSKQKTYPGGFSEWAYFHYGRISLSTPGWAPPPFSASKDTVKRRDNRKPDKDLEFLLWADSAGIEAHVPWTPIEHPDFPGKTVEVGGITPFARTVPPSHMIDSLTIRHFEFLVWLGQHRPSLEIANLETRDLGENITRISLNIINRGLFPTLPAIAERNQWAKLVKAELSIDDDQAIISGNRKHIVKSLKGGQSEKISWLVRGKGRVSIEVGAPQTGFTTASITL